MMFHLLMGTTFVYYILAIYMYYTFLSPLLSFWHRIIRTLLILGNYRYQTRKGNITKFLPAHSETPHNTTHKIANKHMEFKYYIFTSKKTLQYLIKWTGNWLLKAVPLFWPHNKEVIPLNYTFCTHSFDMNRSFLCSHSKGCVEAALRGRFLLPYLIYLSWDNERCCQWKLVLWQ